MTEKSAVQKHDKAIAAMEVKLGLMEEAQQLATEQILQLKEQIKTDGEEMKKNFSAFMEMVKRELQGRNMESGEGSNMKGGELSCKKVSDSPSTPTNVATVTEGVSKGDVGIDINTSGVGYLQAPFNPFSMPEVPNMSNPNFAPNFINPFMQGIIHQSIIPTPQSTLNPFAPPIHPHFTQNSISTPNPIYSLPNSQPSFTYAQPTQIQHSNLSFTDGNNNRTHTTNSYYKIPKLDFPRFDGKDPRGWISKCEKFFQLNPIADPRAKVLCAALYMDDEADTWYKTLEWENNSIKWPEFTQLVIHRFSKGGYENIVGQFNKLIQRGRVDDYITQFDELRTYVMAQEDFHRESYYIDNFISGLEEEIAQHLYNHKPKTLQEARDLARGQEHYLTILDKRYRTNYPTTKFTSQTTLPKTTQQNNKPNLENSIPTAATKPNFEGFRKLSIDELNEKKRRGLCFHCDQKYMPGHDCRKKKLYVMMGENDEPGGENEELALVWEGEEG